MLTSAVRAGAGPRLLRTAVFTAVCVVLAGVGHTLASGAAVPWWPLALGFLGLFAVAAPFAGRERSLPGIAAGLTAGQLALHTVFGLGQHGAMGAMGPMGTAAQSAVGHPGGDTSALVALAGRLVCGAGAAPLSLAQAHSIVTAAGLDPGSAQAAPHRMAATAATSTVFMLPTLPMALGHLLAALATGWLLRRGEIALFRLTRLSHGVAEGALVGNLRAALALVRALRTGLPEAPAQGPRAGYAPLPAPLWTAGEALQHTVIRRGPPSAYAPAA
ncbi:hypothetical protein OG204_19590 [Streptomyces sp. NBC_01387]|uniref:hypothetical protein n=1 Tax=unclassified Streptomyces TaxID=2593676 RepID=UPI0020250887|nr:MULTISPECIES: hypothetical protein [unclassified Streptomyces]WSC21011.1 hypothetical protein OIE60_15740 [Streptomyces sp. NBC_01766]WSV54997.1 hypothetical protein OG282_15565 [Streptomyces sp. NBC_01014]